MTTQRLLLLSNSKNSGSVYLSHAREPLHRLLGESRKTIAFLPYAAVRFPFDHYENAVADAFPDYDIISTHRFDSPKSCLEEADAIAVGGGNTFCLIRAIYEYDLIRTVRERIASGVPYIGWSAGSNVACPTICTTNDMPIVEPPAFESFKLIPFQINPHYLDTNPDGHMGETRQDRIEEFRRVNPRMPVLGLREGSWLERDGDSLQLKGESGALLFMGEHSPQPLSPGLDLSFLLQPEIP